MRFTGLLFVSLVNSWSRKTVKPSLSDSWNLRVKSCVQGATFGGLLVKK